LLNLPAYFSCSSGKGQKIRNDTVSFALPDSIKVYISAPGKLNLPEKKETLQMNTRRINALCAAFALFFTVSACSLLGGSTPTATFKAFYDASKKKDVPAMKKTLSKGTLDMFDKLAKEQNKTTDEMLKDVDKDDKSEKMPETRNEKITGDTATLEVKNEKTNKWDTLPFVKENGEWKIALDKFLEDMMKSLGEKMPDSK
jgi:hypothetical protein